MLTGERASGMQLAYKICAVEIISSVVFASSDFFSKFMLVILNAFEYGGPCVRSCHFRGIANTNFKKQKFTRFQRDATHDLNCT